MRKNERQARALQLLDTVGLAAAGDRPFAGYSRGMRRKLTIAAGLIHRPSILFLDEPTTGIDVASARQIRQLIADLHRGGTTIFLTTHYIEEAERLCERVAFIVSGRIVRIDTVAALVQPVQERHVLLMSVPDARADLCATLASAFPDHSFRAVSAGQVRVEATTPVRVAPLVRYLEEQGVEVAEARRVRPSLEDVFVQITGIEAEAVRTEGEEGEGAQ
jgi:ABC-2 type transport system ATP-binding protein